jgi:lysophospholipid acyltransferase (LPLAT)-like uncharacterized protein
MKAIKRSIVEALAPRLAYRLIRFLGWSARIEYRNRDVLERARRESGPYILTFWHSRFALMPFCYPGNRMVVLHSRHRDARMLAQVMARFGHAQAWGSTTAGGATGVRQILRFIRDGHDVGMTPDGPRGPRRRVQPGVIALARLSGKPIVPVAYSARPARRLGSWDRTLVPWPFARALFVYGEAIRVPRDADETAQEALRARLEQELDRLTDLCDDELGVPREDPRPEVAAT